MKPKTEANGKGKGIKLRDAAFSRAFIELPPLQKIQRLTTESRYETTALPRDNPTPYEQALKEWHEQRAKEIKYVYLGKRTCPLLQGGQSGGCLLPSGRRVLALPHAAASSLSESPKA